MIQDIPAYEKISNFIVDHKFQLSKISGENRVARLRSKSVQILSSLTSTKYSANISSYKSPVKVISLWHWKDSSILYNIVILQ